MTEQFHIQRSLFYSIVDGVFFTIMVGCGERFFIPFALMLGANYFEIGLLASLPLLFGSLSQLSSNSLIEKLNSRKKVVLQGARFQGLMFIPMIILVLFFKETSYLFIFITIIYWIGGNIISPAWNSWMGDLVDLQSRGSYFGKRNKIMEISTLLTFVAAGYFLHLMQIHQKVITGFVILFGVALIARFFSVHFLSKKYEPSFTIKDNAKFTFFEFVKKLKTTNFGRFVLFSALMNFSFYIAVPFFIPYMFKELGFSYLQYMVIVAANMASRLIFLEVWGQYIDRYGTKKSLALTASLLPLAVGVWLISNDFYFIILIHVLSGFVWSGFELSSFTFVLDSTSSEKRSRCVAYYNVLNGFFILLGSLVGSQVIKFQIFSAPYVFSAFFVSFVLRALFVIHFIPKLKEVRSVEPISYKKLFIQVFVSPLVRL